MRVIRFDPRRHGSRNGVIVVRGFHAGNYAPPGRGRFDRFLYGLATGVVVGAILFGLGLVKAEEDGEAPRFAPSSRGNRAAVLDRSEVVDLAAEVFGADVAQYVANIAWCESRHRPAARSAGWDRVFGWYEYLGLMQVERGIWAPLAVVLTGSGDLTDPYVNLVTARAIQQEQGWRAWPVCSR